ncbi:Penicillin-binding protein 4* [Flavobacterium sp. CECT 9288]|uniref:serine hydrolase domain-containing protein n=1 Tax=Flavobacterium sp. CECT 9288 TaxID=2845819 RepID=UPI001E537C30|nr:serine hydrolase domain-containing protein [Flavobacterium sp. CECT 9288]CAH0335878.1 Penicillin-binding protein 4* [Flavobacterium sp. CECT 9288]
MKIINIKSTYLLLIAFIIIGNPLNSVYSQNLEAKIDSLLLKVFTDKNGPGGEFLVAKAGKPIYQKSFGKANLELDVNLTSDNVFQIGSMTKQFTAISILILEEKGKLSVNDLVSKHIPDYPLGDKITLHHLLTHTSGIKDFTKMKSLRDISQKEMTPKMMVDFFKNEPADFAPGEKFDYNNSGYVLLGYIIELVSGEKYEEFINKNIFDKVGMNNSQYASDRKIILKRAYGYQKKEYGYVNKTQISFSIPFSSGSLMSTTGDMFKWQNALNLNLLLNTETLKKAFTKYKLNNGEEFTYGYGWHLINVNGNQLRRHGGSVFGFKSMGVYIPSEDIYVIGLTNCDCNSPTQVTEEIALLTLKALKKG